MTKEMFQSLLDRYVQGTCTEKEKVLFDQFVEKIVKHPPEWKLENEEKIRYDIYKNIRGQIEKQRAPVKLVNVIRSSRWLRVAALLAIILSATLYFLVRKEPLSLVTISTRNGERDTVLLSDGSVIYLNESSQVSFYNKFEKDKRSVTLTGEAFFEVAKDKERPFTVYARGFKTVALGTSFNIHALGDSSDIKVSLFTGKVEVSAWQDSNLQSDNKFILTPHKQVHYRSAEKRVVVEEFNPTFVLAWRSGKISFENEPLDQVLTTLEKVYQVHIQFNKLVTHECIINSTFERSESIENILSILSFSNNLKFSQQDRGLIITR